jgi:hypothetical protein
MKDEKLPTSSQFEEDFNCHQTVLRGASNPGSACFHTSYFTLHTF